MSPQATLQSNAEPHAELREMQWATALLSRRDGAGIKQLIDTYLSAHNDPRHPIEALQSKRQLSDLLASTATRLLPHLNSPSEAASSPRFSGLLGMELEGLSQEDQEFEAARQFMRLTRGALGQLRRHASRPDAAHHAFFQSARLYAPGLLTLARPTTPTAARNGFPVSGRWSRRGYTITLRP